MNFFSKTYNYWLKNMHQIHTIGELNKVLAALFLSAIFASTSQQATTNQSNNTDHLDTLMKKHFVKRLEELSFVNQFTQSVVADTMTSNTVRQVPSSMYSYVNPTPLTKHNNKTMYQQQFSSSNDESPDLVKFDLLLWSDEAARECLNLDIDQSNDDYIQTLTGYLSGSTLLPTELTRSYAHCYAGYQFGHYAGQLGDGRAISLGQIRNNRTNELWELQLKGAGMTPYSRRADGRAVLRSSIREFLCSEAMYHLGVPTTRAVSLVKSHDEVVARDEFYNWNVQLEHAAIVLRLAPSFVRFGSFEVFFLRYRNDEKMMKSEWRYIDMLLDYVIRNHYAHLLPSPDNDQSPVPITRDIKLQFLKEVISRTAKLFAHWQTIGFVHGVLNTDNTSILGLTIDYGPFGFVDYFDSDYVPNHSDSEGRYSYTNQPEIGFWNCDKLTSAVAPSLFIFPSSQPDLEQEDQSSDKVAYSQQEMEKYKKDMLSEYWTVYNREYLRMMREKLGINQQPDSEELQESDSALIEDLFEWMNIAKADMTNFFRRLSNIENSESASVETIYESCLNKEKGKTKLQEWLNRYMDRLKLTNVDQQTRKQHMDSANPKYILRNWMAHEAIQSAKKGDYSYVKELFEVLKKPYEEQSQEISDKYAVNAPQWSQSLKCSCSS